MGVFAVAGSYPFYGLHFRLDSLEEALNLRSTKIEYKDAPTSASASSKSSSTTLRPAGKKIVIYWQHITWIFKNPLAEPLIPSYKYYS